MSLININMELLLIRLKNGSLSLKLYDIFGISHVLRSVINFVWKKILRVVL